METLTILVGCLFLVVLTLVVGLLIVDVWFILSCVQKNRALARLYDARTAQIKEDK